jgi:O-antigen/teichoic acid export membrane protein
LAGTGIAVQLPVGILILSLSLPVAVVVIGSSGAIVPAAIMGLSALFSVAAGVVLSIQAGKNRMQWQLVSQAQAALAILLLIWLVSKFPNLMAPALAQTVAAILGGSALLLMFITRHGGIRLRDWPLTRKILVPGLALTAVALVQQVHWQADAFLVGRLSSSQELGYLASAGRLLPVMRGVAQVLTMASLPTMLALVEQDKVKFQRLFNATMSYATLIGAVLTLGLIASAKTLFALLYPTDFQPGVVPFLIYALTLAPLIGHWVALNGLFALGRLRELLVAYVVALIVQVGGGLILVPIRGSSGMALANLASELALAFAMGFLYVRSLRVRLQTRLIGVGCSILASWAMVGVLARWSFPGAALAAFGVLVGVLFLAGGLRVSDLRTGVNYVRELVGRRPKAPTVEGDP